MVEDESSFEAAMAARSAADYADFLMPHLASDSNVLDMGCGSGEISIGIASMVGHVIGVDLEEEEFAAARTYAHDHGIANIEFRTGNVYELDLRDEHFDVALCHSVLEQLDRPIDGLREISRTLKPGGVLGVASVEYGGLILAGPDEPLLRRFYAIREQLWLLDGADPYRGRALRGLLTKAGFERVAATTKFVCYGTAEKVKSFGLGRAEDCLDEWYASEAQANGFATNEELSAMAQAWRTWSGSSDAYAAFAWCRAIGWKPSPR
jgi:ubiquinone/menaquinone biosynthesis C-methylase UbiE